MCSVGPLIAVLCIGCALYGRGTAFVVHGNDSHVDDSFSHHEEGSGESLLIATPIFHIEKGDCHNDSDCGHHATCTHNPITKAMTCECDTAFEMDADRNCIQDEKHCSSGMTCDEGKICCKFNVCDGQTIQRCMSVEGCDHGGCGINPGHVVP